MATTTGSARRERTARPGSNFEMHAWFFMRVSGLFLVVLALTHWTIMHFMNRLGVENSQWIINRYQNIFWPTFDAAMLLFAMLHGLNGARWVLEDYVQNRTALMICKIILFSATFLFIVFGLITIFMLPHTKVS